ncbi:type I polyketide synthase, partial [Chloroflexi bacterium TSY]|nr:type I polyketide synthase [Chloroflexi bacterium TSY]
MVTVHLACESLLNGECDVALAGGVSVRVPQKAGYHYTEGMIFSPDGHTRAFDAKAGGTIFSSGAGIVALKRLEEALSDGDTVLAIIRGSAINNDGAEAKVGYTAPSLNGQADVITQALAAADVAPETVTYIETHGTATALGDLIELSALKEVFAGTAPGQIAIGSVKTNIGHTVQAAGIASLIKTVLMLQHGQLVPSLNFDAPNPQLDLANNPFYVNTTTQEWTSQGMTRRAGVSSFGMGGTNAHVVLEESPSLPTADTEEERTNHLLTLSAKHEDALKELASRYEQYLAIHRSTPLQDICYTASVGRTHFSHRLAVVADSSAEMGKKLAAFTAGEETTGVVVRQAGSNSDQPQIAFLFTGQGSQYVNMGRQLYETEPVFRLALDRCAEILTSYLEIPLLEILYPERIVQQFTRDNEQFLNPDLRSPIDQTAYAQPALFAVEYALSELWRSWGVEPDVVLGHSVGEVVAACVAGVFSLEDGLKLIAERGRLMQQLPQDGQMAVVFADEERVRTAISPHVETVSIAAINGPQNIVISGARDAIQMIVDQLAVEGIQPRSLKVSHAFHSSLMEPMLADFEQTAAEIVYSPPGIKLISNRTGQLVPEELVTTATYWCRHVRETVRFSTGMQTLHELGCEIFIELGPEPTLLALGRHCLPNDVGDWLPSLRKNQIDGMLMLQSLATLYANGIDIDWAGFHRNQQPRRVGLPTYPFQRKRYWLEAST